MSLVFIVESRELSRSKKISYLSGISIYEYEERELFMLCSHSDHHDVYDHPYPVSHLKKSNCHIKFQIKQKNMISRIANGMMFMIAINKLNYWYKDIKNPLCFILFKKQLIIKIFHIEVETITHCLLFH